MKRSLSEMIDLMKLNCILLESELDTIIEGYTFKNWQWEKIFRE